MPARGGVVCGLLERTVLKNKDKGGYRKALNRVGVIKKFFDAVYDLAQMLTESAEDFRVFLLSVPSGVPNDGQVWIERSSRLPEALTHLGKWI